MNKPQALEINGAKVVVLPIADYDDLIERSEMLTCIESFDAAMARLAVGEETIPVAIAGRILDGESAIKVFREYRGLSQRELAEAAGISAPGMSKIEKSGTASVDTLAKITKQLGLTVDDLI